MFRFINKMKSFKRLVVMILLRLCLGAVFIYASVHKILYPLKFKDVLGQYDILPYWLVNIMAVTLPWFEFWIGILVITGIFVRSCAVMQSGLLLSFIIAIGLNILRGLNFYCGCFENDNLFGGMNYLHIFLNIILLAMTGILFLLERRRFSHRFFWGKTFYEKNQEMR